MAEFNPHGGRRAQCAECQKSFTTRVYGGGRKQVFCSEKCCSVQWGRKNERRRFGNRLRRSFGLDVESYERQLRKQRGCCAICRRKPNGVRLAVDHDHATGRNRGLLCAPCNRHVGYFECFGRQVVAYLENKAGFTPEESINRKG